MHFWQLIHDIKPTKCTNLFLGYLYYNITLNFAMCFGPKRTIIRESNKNNIYLLSPWSRVLLEKLTGSQLVKKFPAFYWTRRFITAFTIARHLSLSWASSIQSIPPYPTSRRSILILLLLLFSSLYNVSTSSCARLAIIVSSSSSSFCHSTRLPSIPFPPSVL